MSLVVFAWILMVIGVIAAGALVIFVEFGRDESVPFTVSMILIASLSIGFSIHMFLF